MTVSRARQINPHIGNQMARVRAQHHHSVGHLHGFLDVMRDHKHRLDAALFARPQLEHFLTQVFGGQHVQGGERLIHEQRVRPQHQGACNAHALPHAARQFLRIRRFEAVQADHVDGIQSQFGAFRTWYAARLQTEFHIVLHGEPRHQREGLEHECDAGIRTGQGLAAILDRAAGRLDQSGQRTQECGLAGTRTAQNGHDLALVQVERYVVEHGEFGAVVGREALADVLGFDDGVLRGHRPQRTNGFHCNSHIILLKSLVQCETALGHALQRVPEQAVDGHHEYTHHGHTDDGPHGVAAFGGLGDMRA